MDLEVRRIFLVRGEHKKAHCASKPLGPTYKKFSASVHKEHAHRNVATPRLIFVDFHLYFHSFVTPDALKVR